MVQLKQEEETFRWRKHHVQRPLSGKKNDFLDLNDFFDLNF